MNGKKKITAAEVAFRNAASVHIRAAKLLAMWVAFDPYGAVIYYIQDLVNTAWEIRDAYFLSDDGISLEMDNQPVRRSIKKENSVYGTLKNHMKGLTAAIRRLEKSAKLVPSVDVETEITTLKDLLDECKSHAA